MELKMFKIQERTTS